MSVWDDTEHPDTAEVRRLVKELEELRTEYIALMKERHELARLVGIRRED